MMLKRALSSSPKPVAAAPLPAIDLILDSGAFSAWKLGKAVDLIAYCDYLEANKDWIGTYINLDTINPDDPQASARQSFESYLYMRKRGLDPMVVFHAKEDFSWLQEMIDSGASYIGLAALSLGSHTLRSAWYEHAWQYLANAAGEPITKVHALGEGRMEPLASFPWYSADSTSWIYSAQRNGIIPISPGKLVVQRNDGLNQKGKPSLDAIPELDQEVFNKFLDKYGISREVLNRAGPMGHSIRSFMALNYYLRQEKLLTKEYPKKYKQEGFFKSLPNAARSGVILDKFRFYPVIGDASNAWAVLAFAQGRRALSSYYYLNTAKTAQLKDFCFAPFEDTEISALYSEVFSRLKEATGG